MKLIEVLNALIPLRALTEARFTSFKKSRELAILRKKVEFEGDFYAKEEKKIVETYAEKNEAGEPIILDGGRIKLKDIESKIAFDKEITDLRNFSLLLSAFFKTSMIRYTAVAMAGTLIKFK